MTYTVLVVMSIIWLVPLIWIILSAFRCEYQLDGTFIGRVTSNFFPKQYGFKNFSDLFTATYYGVPKAFPRWMLNTLIIAVVDCLISTFLVLSVAYCMSKLKFKLRKPFMNITMIIGLFPGFMSMIAIYFLLKSIGLTGNPQHPEYSVIGLILAYSAGAGLGFRSRRASSTSSRMRSLSPQSWTAARTSRSSGGSSFRLQSRSSSIRR